MRYYMLAVVSVFFWSFNVIIGSYLQNILTPWQIAFFRWSIACFLLMPFVAKNVWRHRRVYLKHSGLIVAMSAIGITFSNTFVYYASYTVTAIEMSLIAVTGPIFLILFAHFLGKERIRLHQLIGIIAALAGVITMITKGRLLSLGSIQWHIGDLWMVGMALSFGFYSYLMSEKPKELPEIPLLSVCVFIGAIFCTPFFVYDCFQHPLNSTNITSTTVSILLYMGVFNSVLAYLFWNISLVKVGSLKLSIVYYIMPIFSTIEAFFILSERVYWSQLGGGILILGGILLANARRRQKWKIERA